MTRTCSFIFQQPQKRDGPWGWHGFKRALSLRGKYSSERTEFIEDQPEMSSEFKNFLRTAQTVGPRV